MGSRESHHSMSEVRALGNLTEGEFVLMASENRETTSPRNNDDGLAVDLRELANTEYSSLDEICPAERNEMLDGVSSDTRSISSVSMSSDSLENTQSEHSHDSVDRFIVQLRDIMDYATSRHALRKAGASYLRDSLRTLLVTSVADAERIHSSENAHTSGLTRKYQRTSNAMFALLPLSITQRAFRFLEGADLARARGVCRQWKEFASCESLWKRLCLEKWAAMDTDEALWDLVNSSVSTTDPEKWRKVYPAVAKRPKWRCRLQKTGRFICHVVAHQIGGAPLGERGLPYTLVVERRFNVAHLQTFVLPNASVLYFEPETPEDRPGYEEFIEYLLRRTRAGLALEDQRRFIFVPPCSYSRHLSYDGAALLCVVQISYPPFAP